MALASAVLLPAAAQAADLQYTYAEAGYSQAETGIGDGARSFTGGQGLMLDGSYAFGSHWFLEAAYRYNDFHQHQPATSVDLAPQSLRFGGGLHAAMADSVDFTAHLDYVLARTSVTVDQPDSEIELNDTGYLAGIGLRIHPTDLFEFDLGLDHDKLGLGRQAVPVCSPTCVVMPEARQDEKETLVSVAARYDFGAFIGSVEYRRGNAQGWRELLVSLRMGF
jgi:opacity protein-like surface antigen